ncbi:MAG: ATP-binding protein [Desulfosarcinaceae bacterium]
MPDRRVSIRRRRFFPKALLLPVCLFIGLCAAPLPAADQVVRVGVYQNPPKVFLDDAGQPAGVFIDVIRHIAALEGWHLSYVYGTWGEGLDRLQRGEIDLMPDVAQNADREVLFDFHTVPVLSSWFQVYARKSSGIHSILDLAEKRITVLERSVQEAAFKRLAEGFGLNATIIALPDYQSSFEKVAQGEADAAITNRFFGVRHAKQFGLEDTAVIFNPSNLFFAAPQNRQKPLLDAIDGHLTRMKQDSSSPYYQSVARWTSEKVEFALPDWVWMAGLLVGLALLMSLAGSIVLKRQVNARTRQLRQINLEMEQRIEQRTAELAEAMEKARAADHLKSAFLATMSHELRTPLNSIIGFTGILLQGLAGPLNDEQNKQMRMVQNSARHLLALINDVLDISKIEAGQLSLAPESFALRGAVEKAATLVAPMAEKKGIDLRVNIADDVADITTDQRRLEQILINLLNNAVKFTEQGKVEISCRGDGDFYRLSVSDTGIGIRPEEIDGLFQPFHQIDTGLSRKHEGTGLGLSICRKLVDMMGGRIEVRSRWAQGSTFDVWVPRQ